jgi:hypothetical protein
MNKIKKALTVISALWRKVFPSSLSDANASGKAELWIPPHVMRKFRPKGMIRVDGELVPISPGPGYIPARIRRERLRQAGIQI